MTGSGKTHTMLGAHGNASNADDEEENEEQLTEEQNYERLKNLGLCNLSI